MVTSHGHWLGQLALALEKLDWPNDAEILVEIGGTQVSGIYQGEDYNKKWASQYGDRKYNKDAFIVIKQKETVISSNAPIPSEQEGSDQK